MRSAGLDYPVFSVNAWSEVYLGDPGGVQSAPELTWRDRRFIEQLEVQGRLELRERRQEPFVAAKHAIHILHRSPVNRIAAVYRGLARVTSGAH